MYASSAGSRRFQRFFIALQAHGHPVAASAEKGDPFVSLVDQVLGPFVGPLKGISADRIRQIAFHLSSPE